MLRLLTATSVLLLAACSSQQATPETTTTAGTVEPTACERLIAALPRTLDGDSLIETTATSASWGTPRMTLECGVDLPADYKPTSEIYVVNNISWFAEEQPDGFRFTGVGREPLVAIYVPDTHSPEVNPLADLEPVMAENTEVTGPAGEAS